MKACLTIDFFKVHIQYTYPSWTEHVTCTGKKNTHMVSVRNPVRRTPLRRRKHTWENKTKMDIIQKI
jgi:hypothetical protein